MMLFRAIAASLAGLALIAPAGQAHHETVAVSATTSSSWVQSLLRHRESRDQQDRSLQRLSEDLARDEIQRRQRDLEQQQEQKPSQARTDGWTPVERPLRYDTTPDLDHALAVRRAQSRLRTAEQTLRTDQIVSDQRMAHDRDAFVRRTERLIRQRDASYGNVGPARRELRYYRSRQSFQDHRRTVDRFVNDR